MADSLGAHVSTMIMRVLGTFVGAVTGYIIAEISADNTVAQIALLVVWNAACTFSRANATYGYACMVAGFTAIVVSVGSDPAVGTVSSYAFVRIEETLIGVLVGMVIHNLILPTHASTLLHAELLRSIEIVRQAFEYSFGKYQNRAGEYVRVDDDDEPNGNGKAGPREDEKNRLNGTAPPPAGHQAASSLSSVPIRGDPPTTSVGPSPFHPPVHDFVGVAVSSFHTHDHLRHTHHRVPLDAHHTFRRLGPKLFSSIESQAILCAAADLEPTLWSTKFPATGYQRLIAIQRTISLYLYCMDLALQRIVQSGSMYLMPDLDHMFARIKAQVLHSLGQIREGLWTYSGQDAEEQQQQEQQKEKQQQRHGSSPKPSLSSSASNGGGGGGGDPLDPDDSSSIPHTLRARLRAQSLARQQDLLSLTTSLLELERRYKEWIDQRILAKRNEIRQRMEVEAEEQQEEEAAMKEEAAAAATVAAAAVAAGTTTGSSAPGTSIEMVAMSQKDVTERKEEDPHHQQQQQPSHGGTVEESPQPLCLHVNEGGAEAAFDASPPAPTAVSLLSAAAVAADGGDVDPRAHAASNVDAGRSRTASAERQQQQQEHEQEQHDHAQPVAVTTAGDKAPVVYYPSIRQSRDYHFLKPIPLDTPVTKVRGLGAGAYVSEMDPLDLSPPAVMGQIRDDVLPSREMPTTAGGGAIGAAADGASHHPGDAFAATVSIVPSSRSASQPAHAAAATGGLPVGSRPSVLQHQHRLAHMDVTFTRSMDVLALNTFMFSTRGLIREVLGLSQAVRVLLHMQHPGPFEQAF